MTETHILINATAAVMHSFDELWPETPQAMIAMLQHALSLVPETARDTAILRTDTDYDSNHITMTIQYPRPENDQEYFNRITRETNAAAARKGAELAKLRELRAKYGDDA